MANIYNRADVIDIINWMGDNFELDRIEGPVRYFRLKQTGEVMDGEAVMNLYERRFI